MDTNFTNSNNANTNAPAQSTDWAAVRSFYLTCRSYKQTAEHFGLSAETIKTRCRRENWKSVNPEPSQEVQKSNVEPSNVNPEPLQEVQMNPDEPSIEPSAVPSEPCDVPSAASFTCFPALPMRENLISSSIRFGQPWLEPIIAHDKLRDKAAYRTYICTPSTKDCVFSGLRGMNKEQLVCRENPAVSMIAVVADYDMQITDVSA